MIYAVIGKTEDILVMDTFYNLENAYTYAQGVKKNLENAEFACPDDIRIISLPEPMDGD